MADSDSRHDGTRGDAPSGGTPGEQQPKSSDESGEQAGSAEPNAPETDSGRPSEDSVESPAESVGQRAEEAAGSAGTGRSAGQGAAGPVGPGSAEEPAELRPSPAVELPTEPGGQSPLAGPAGPAGPAEPAEEAAGSGEPAGSAVAEGPSALQGAAEPVGPGSAEEPDELRPSPAAEGPRPGECGARSLGTASDEAATPPGDTDGNAGNPDKTGNTDNFDNPHNPDADKVAEPAGGPVVRRRRRAGRWVAGGLALVLVAAGATAYALYDKLDGNIRKEHVDKDQLGANRPAKLNKSVNILLVGSDSRDGANHQYWSPDISGERSDTAILVHISPNRDRAVALSFPRDSMVHVPECRRKNGQQVPAFFGMINAAFAYAGATCTWKTIESTTNIHIDHYVKIDFAGFKRVVDALGGVEICAPRAVHDPRANLRLRAGRQVVKGDQALGYVRTRYGLGDGSDLERIQRQQKFMASVVKKATSGAMLTDPPRAYRFLDAVTKSISTDDELSLPEMKKLATSLRGISAGTVRFVTVPVEAYPKDPNRVQWNMAQAGPLFEAIRKDTAPPPPAPAPPAAKPAMPKPEDVKVRVVNGSRRVVRELRGQRFKVTKGTAPKQPESTIRYGTGGERLADALAVYVPGVRLVPDQSIPTGTVSLVVGTGGVQVKTPEIPKVGGEIVANQNPCR